jgi:hypothetical protein
MPVPPPEDADAPSDTVPSGSMRMICTMLTPSGSVRERVRNSTPLMVPRWSFEVQPVRASKARGNRYFMGSLLME